MSAARQTKIFGIRVRLDPKILIAVLVALAGFLYWYNSRGDEGISSPSIPARSQSEPGPTSTFKPAAVSQRRVSRSNERGTLRMRPIDPTRGDIDPTLRLDLLARLQNLQLPENSRNLFETGPAVADASQPVPHGPTIMPKPIPVQNAPGISGPAVAFTVPLKYYGFVKPIGKRESNRGFFLDGDNVLVASEGEIVKQRYLIVALTPLNARLEDTQMKQPQVIPVVPEAAGEGAAAGPGPAGAGPDGGNEAEPEAPPPDSMPPDVQPETPPETPPEPPSGAAL